MENNDKVIIDLYKSGLSAKKIELKTGVSASQVRRILKRNNINGRSNKTDLKLEQIIIENYINGESSEIIANKFDINGSTVCRILKRNGVKIRPATENKRKYKIVEDFFENIDTEEKAYFLGFVFADGCISKRDSSLTINLHKQDIDIIHKLGKLIYINGDYNLTQDRDRYIKIGFYSKKIKDDLAKYGCVPAKTFIIRIPNINKNLMRHFLRGVFDGDGCLSINGDKSGSRVGLTGCSLFIQDIKDYIKKELKIDTQLRLEKRSKTEEVFDISYGSRINVSKLLNYLYKDASIYLDRKYNKYLEIIKTMHCNSPDYYGTKKYIKYNGNALTKNYIKSLSLMELENVSSFLFDYFRTYGFPYPKYSEECLLKDFENLRRSNLSVKNKEIFVSGNFCDSGINIFKHFCEHYYEVKSTKLPSMIEAFSSDDLLMKVINNRLGITYKECFSITGNMIRQGMRNSYTAFGASVFKPSVAKFIYDKFAPNNSVVLDISAGFGQRMLGASASNKVHKYIGLDPWQKTIDSLNKMKDFLELKNIELHNIGSEKFCDENLKVDFCFSSPPFFNKEIYSSDESQAYFGRTFDEFVVQWWVPTVNNVWRMLNKDGLFVVNMNKEMFEKMMKTINNFKLIDTYNIQYRRNNLGKNSFDYFFILKRI